MTPHEFLTMQELGTLSREEQERYLRRVLAATLEAIAAEIVAAEATGKMRTYINHYLEVAKSAFPGDRGHLVRSVVEDALWDRPERFIPVFEEMLANPKLDETDRHEATAMVDRLRMIDEHRKSLEDL